MKREHFDLATLRVADERQIMAIALPEEGEPWKGTAVPYKNAAGPVAAQLAAEFPGVFETAKDAEMWFVMTHFRNMHHKANSVGQEYP